MERLTLSPAVLVVVAVLLAVAAPPAEAASTVAVEGGVLQVVAGPGETNIVKVSEPSKPPGSTAPSQFTVRDDSAGTTPGAGCERRPEFFSPEASVACSAAGVQRISVRLGDGDDSADQFTAAVPMTIAGEDGHDRIRMLRAPGAVSEGGEGNDDLQFGDDVRGGPGNDLVSGFRLLDGGDGNDVLHKTNSRVGGRLAGGAGDDSLRSDDSLPDQLQCGAGRDVITNADTVDSNDGSCESGKGVAGPPEAVMPRVTVFELPKGRARPGRDGRLAVWMKCTVPRCAVTVQIRAAGEFQSKRFVRFRPRQAPVRKLVVGTKAKIYRLRLSRAQRRGLRRIKANEGIAAKVTAKGPGGRTSLLTDGQFCTRSDPCKDLVGPR